MLTVLLWLICISNSIYFNINLFSDVTALTTPGWFILGLTIYFLIIKRLWSQREARQRTMNRIIGSWLKNKQRELDARFALPCNKISLNSIISFLDILLLFKAYITIDGLHLDCGIDVRKKNWPSPETIAAPIPRDRPQPSEGLSRTRVGC